MNASTSGEVRNMVLVDGAYADGSPWSPVITRLQAAGLTVTAVQNPLSSQADDIAHPPRLVVERFDPIVGTA